MPGYSNEVTKNVDLLDQRAFELAKQEMERAQSIDQKAAGVIAAAIVLIPAGVLFATSIDSLHGGHGARVLWAVLLGVVMVLLLIALGCATISIIPRAYRIVIHVDVLKLWGTHRNLNRDPTTVRGELMEASIHAVGGARDKNRTKAVWLGWAFGFFAAAIVATVVLAVAVGIHAAEPAKAHASTGPATRTRHPKPVA